jgi:hypothetical protein
MHWVRIENMSTPRERLTPYKQVFREATGTDEVKYRSTPVAVQVDCAIEIIEALSGLTFAVSDMANCSVTVMNNLIEGIDEATALRHRRCVGRTGGRHERHRLGHQSQARSP